MNTLLLHLSRRVLHTLLSCIMLVATVVSESGCSQSTASGDVAPEGFEKGAAGIQAADKARHDGFKTLHGLWRQRKAHNITLRVLPFLNSPSVTARKRAAMMLGRLEDARALKRLEALRAQAPSQDLMQSSETSGVTLYPELPLAIGRIKARSLGGRRRLDTMLSEVNLSFSGLASLTNRINGDRYGWGYLGNQVIHEAVDVLAEEKRRGRNVDHLVSSLTLRPGEEALLQAISTSATTEAERLLDYMARAKIVGGDEALVTESLFDLQLPSGVMLDKISAKLHDRTRYPNPFGLASVLGEMAMEKEQKDKRVLTMLQALAKDKSRGTTSQIAQSALNQITVIDMETNQRGRSQPRLR